jgi:hypothetical protein
MTTLQLESSSQALSLDGARAGVLATRLAELMGVFERPAGARVDPALVGSAIEAAARAGLAEQVAAREDAAEPGESTILAFLEALRNSPRPAGEIQKLAEIFGHGILGQLAGTSEPSLRRYAAQERPTPDPIAQRIHFLAQLVAILRGSFNEFGIRRWFERPHPALQGRTPAALLRGEFDPSDAAARATLDAAMRLLW